MNDGNGGNDENAEDDVVLRGIAGRGDGGMMGPKSSSSDEAGSNNDDSDNEGEQQEDAVAS